MVPDIRHGSRDKGRSYWTTSDYYRRCRRAHHDNPSNSSWLREWGGDTEDRLRHSASGGIAGSFHSLAGETRSLSECRGPRRGTRCPSCRASRHDPSHYEWCGSRRTSCPAPDVRSKTNCEHGPISRGSLGKHRSLVLENGRGN